VIDLHCHSTFSDGTFSPEEIIEAAEKTGLFAVALTDHDTVEGIENAVEAAASKTVRFVPGVEISAEIENGTLHILGLFIDHKNKALLEMLGFAEEQRRLRNLQIAARLQAIGISISVDEMEETAGPGVMGRPHFAALLQQKGYVATPREAFLRYLGKGGAAFVPKTRIPRHQAVSIIRQAGGVPVLAHPDQTRRGGRALDILLEELCELGLLAVETHYSGYSPTRVRKYARMAQAHGLAKSGGSDFHGAAKPGLALGFGPGTLNVPDEFYFHLAALAGKTNG
jgi:3',5'-nucleoside bisphosphate phosphatase